MAQKEKGTQSRLEEWFNTYLPDPATGEPDVIPTSKPIKQLFEIIDLPPEYVHMDDSDGDFGVTFQEIPTVQLPTMPQPIQDIVLNTPIFVTGQEGEGIEGIQNFLHMLAEQARIGRVTTYLEYRTQILGHEGRDGNVLGIKIVTGRGRFTEELFYDLIDVSVADNKTFDKVMGYLNSLGILGQNDYEEIVDSAHSEHIPDIFFETNIFVTGEDKKSPEALYHYIHTLAEKAQVTRTETYLSYRQRIDGQKGRDGNVLGVRIMTGIGHSINDTWYDLIDESTADEKTLQKAAEYLYGIGLIQQYDFHEITERYKTLKRERNAIQQFVIDFPDEEQRANLFPWSAKLSDRKASQTLQMMSDYIHRHPEEFEIQNIHAPYQLDGIQVILHTDFSLRDEEDPQDIVLLHQATRHGGLINAKMQMSVLKLYEEAGILDNKDVADIRKLFYNEHPFRRT